MNKSRSIGICVGVLANLMFAANPASAQPPQAPTSPPPSRCGPMPYIVGNAESVYQLQLKVTGLWTASPSLPAPALDAGITFQDFRSRMVGAVAQGISEVARVHFCRLAERFPDRAAVVQAAAIEFNDELFLFVDADSYKDVQSKAALLANLRGRCASLANGCPELLQILPQADSRSALRHEDFTSNNWRSFDVTARIPNVASIGGCRSWIRASASDAAGPFLAMFESLDGIIVDYLAGGASRVSALQRLMIGSQAVFQSASQGRFDQARQPSLKGCLETAATAAAPAVPATSTVPAPAAGPAAAAPTTTTGTAPAPAAAPAPPVPTTPTTGTPPAAPPTPPSTPQPNPQPHRA